jgi:hypothetical protein
MIKEHIRLCEFLIVGTKSLMRCMSICECTMVQEIRSCVLGVSARIVEMF